MTQFFKQSDNNHSEANENSTIYNCTLSTNISQDSEHASKGYDDVMLNQWERLKVMMMSCWTNEKHATELVMPNQALLRCALPP